MNPPFQSWQDMSEGEREGVESNLGGLRSGRPDKATAFLWKGLQSLKPGGILIAVLPSALLDNRSAQSLRQAIRNEAELLMLGKFEGFAYFENSTVETAFVVLQKPSGGSVGSPLNIVIAAKGFEDASLRALRGGEVSDDEKAGIELFPTTMDLLPEGSWMPRRRATLDFLNYLRLLKFPQAAALFDVQQGMRTGSKKAFLLTAEDLGRLRKSERSFFRKAAGQGTIVKGQLEPSEFVFYPYAPGGCLLADLAEVEKQLPTYFKLWLAPERDNLEKRRWADPWWLPERPRNWQFERRPKIVSTYFGKPGAFAYDDDGDYVVVEGYGWQWKRESGSENVKFHETELPFAYLALLNSLVFEQIVACFSWRLQGGQLRLESKFLNHVPMPDLSSDEGISAELVHHLISLGRRIAGGQLDDVLSDLSAATAHLYGIPEELLDKLS